MSSVGLPRSPSAAARLIAVVVFPTPPFWLAMATIIVCWSRPDAGEAIVAGKCCAGSINDVQRSNRAPGRNVERRTSNVERRTSNDKLHLVFAHVVRI